MSAMKIASHVFFFILRVYKNEQSWVGMDSLVGLSSASQAGEPSSNPVGAAWLGLH